MDIVQTSGLSRQTKGSGKLLYYYLNIIDFILFPLRTNFNQLRTLKVLTLTEKYQSKLCISLVYSYLCRQLTASRPLQRLGFTGIRCESGTVPAAVSPLATVCLLHSLATDFIVGKAQ